MTCKLNELKPDEGGSVVSISGSSALRQRLMALGFVPGTQLLVRKFAPLGDPIEIKFRSYSLSIRRQDAAQILVEYQRGTQ